MASSSRQLTVFGALLIVAMHVGEAATFNYRGMLYDGGRPAEGSYDVQLTLYSSARGGNAIGGPLTLYAVPLHRGRFVSQVDFGTIANASSAWLAIDVREAGRGYFVASPGRSPVVAEAASTVCPGAWDLGGNAGNAMDSYLGTADNNPLTFEVNGTPAGRMTPAGADGTSTPNVVLGSLANSAGGQIGSAIGGGGDAGQNCGLSNTSTCGNVAQGAFAAIGGGEGNAAGQQASVGGGFSNDAGPLATAGGGRYNDASGYAAAIAGGSSNVGSGYYSVVSGGANNDANGYASVIAGGMENSALGNYATVAGGILNQAGAESSFAAGTAAHVRSPAENGPYGDAGTFIWSDSTAGGQAPFTSTGSNQFLVRATGGVGINAAPLNSHIELSVVANGDPVDYANIFLRQASQPAGILVSAGDATAANNDAGFYLDQYDGSSQYRLLALVGGFTGINHANPDASHVFIVGTAPTNGNGAYLTPGGVWTNGSSRAFKEDFHDVDSGAVLAMLAALPIQTWFYRNDHAEGRHMGPVAEDFRELFGLGSSDGYIGTVDEGGVALAAIQGLNSKEESDIAALRRENAELRSRLDEVVAKLAKIEAARGW